MQTTIPANRTIPPLRCLSQTYLRTRAMGLRRYPSTTSIPTVSNGNCLACASTVSAWLLELLKVIYIPHCSDAAVFVKAVAIR